MWTSSNHSCISKLHRNLFKLDGSYAAVAITLFDAYGVRLVQVPLYHVARFLTREEADRITAEMEGEFRLVS